MSQNLCIDCNQNKRIKHRKICYKCRHIRFKLKNPMRYTYNALRSNAKRRNKYFDLTFEEFKDICYETNYMDKKGITRTSYHLDRDDETLGYTKSNIVVRTNIDNVNKYLKWIGRDIEGKNNFRYIKSHINIDDYEDLPF